LHDDKKKENLLTDLFMAGAVKILELEMLDFIGGAGDTFFY
jgi:hypothetical protein